MVRRTSDQDVDQPLPRVGELTGLRPAVPEDERRRRRLGEHAQHREHLQGGGNLPHTPVIGRSAEFVQRTAELPWPFREPAVRPLARPLRVLDPRRGVPDPGARAQGGGARDARRVAHRPRLDGGRDRPPQGRRRAGRQADLRLRGVRRRRPQGAQEGARAPDAPRSRQHGATRISSSSARSATSRATTTSRASTGSCSSATPPG